MLAASQTEHSVRWCFLSLRLMLDRNETMYSCSVNLCTCQPVCTLLMHTLLHYQSPQQFKIMDKQKYVKMCPNRILLYLIFFVQRCLKCIGTEKCAKMKCAIQATENSAKKRVWNFEHVTHSTEVFNLGHSLRLNSPRIPRWHNMH